MRHIVIFIFSLAILFPFGMNAQLTAINAFKTAPSEILRQLPESTRLDMIDYAQAGIMNKSVRNVRDEDASITYLSENRLDVTVSNTTTIQFFILPIKGRKIIAVIKTVLCPVPDSQLNFYASNWAPINLPLFSAPQLNDWLTAEGKRKTDVITENLPFMLTEYKYDENTKCMTITTHLKEYLSKEAYESINTFIKPELKYFWNGKKFSLIK